MLILQQLDAGGDRNFGYIIGCTETGESAVVDPAMDATLLLEYLKRYGLRVKYLINTHGHYDHVTENPKILELGAELLNYPDGFEKNSIYQEFGLGNFNLELHYTPGHTKDSICIKVDRHLITGDTLFVGKVGGTSTPDSTSEQFKSLNRIMELPDDTFVWPGHNYGAVSMSNIGFEKSNNPFCSRLNSFEEFCWIKSNWGDFKRDNSLI